MCYSKGMRKTTTTLPKAVVTHATYRIMSRRMRANCPNNLLQVSLSWSTAHRLSKSMPIKYGRQNQT